MIPRKEWIEMNRVTVFDRFRWFWNDYGRWILLGVITGTLPVAPYYIELVIDFFSS
jgi:hypothetical protein